MNTVVHNDTASNESLVRQAFIACKETIDYLREITHLDECKYFLDIIENRYRPDYLSERAPDIILFGTGFPSEIIHALTGKAPFFLLGGSRTYQETSDEFVPRDTDPVTRSALGQLFEFEEHWKKSALVVIPCASDAQRKAAYLLIERGWNVVTLWIPAVKNEKAHIAYRSEMEHAIDVICRHVRKRWKNSALKRTMKFYGDVRQSINAFVTASVERTNLIPGPLRLAILDSFYHTENMDEWHDHLQLPTKSLESSENADMVKPKVLLIGSPIYIPNYKIPTLIYHSGIEICDSIDSRDFCASVLTEETLNDQTSLLSHFFDRDFSPAFVKNDQLATVILEAIHRSKPDGIIWHVLKGQIEYDFELNRMEDIFEENDLPVIRLETDYQYQDIEQLRIRIEAFCELLVQKKHERGGVL